MELSKTKEFEPFNCKECHLSFKFEYVLNQHNNCVHENTNIEGTPFMCKSCRTNFSSVRSLSFHKTQFHQVFGTVKRGGCCPACGITVTKLQAHIWRIHEKPKIKCTECEYMTRNNITMKVHFQNNHTNYDLRNKDQCPVCGNVTFNLKSHYILTNCGKNSDDFMGKVKCPQCNKTLKHKYSLQKHMKILCNKVKDKHCPFCAYKTNLRCNMRLHINTQHLGKTALSEKNSTADLLASFGKLCPVCTKLVGNIPLHLNTFHKEADEISQKLKYSVDLPSETKCLKCNFISPTNSGLGYHMAMTHKTTQLHEQRICQFVFKS